MVKYRKRNEWVVAALKPPLSLIVFIVKGLHWIFFAWFEKLLARKRQDRLEHEVKDNLPFLFDECGGQVVPNEGILFPPGFDYAFVTIVVGELSLRFTRGRGELDVDVSAKSVPGEWHPLSVAISALSADDDVKRHSLFSISDVALILQANIGRLQEMFSESQYPRLTERLSKFYAYERAATKQLETEINRRLYG